MVLAGHPRYYGYWISNTRRRSMVISRTRSWPRLLLTLHGTRLRDGFLGDRNGRLWDSYGQIWISRLVYWYLVGSQVYWFYSKKFQNSIRNWTEKVEATPLEGIGPTELTTYEVYMSLFHRMTTVVAYKPILYTSGVVQWFNNFLAKRYKLRSIFVYNNRRTYQFKTIRRKL